MFKLGYTTLLQDEMTLLLRGKKITGKVDSALRQGWGSTKTLNYSYEVDGTLYHGVGTSKRAHHREGSSIELLYHPENTGDSRIKGRTFLKYFVFLLCPLVLLVQIFISLSGVRVRQDWGETFELFKYGIVLDARYKGQKRVVKPAFQASAEPVYGYVFQTEPYGDEDRFFTIARRQRSAPKNGEVTPILLDSRPNRDKSVEFLPYIRKGYVTTQGEWSGIRASIWNVLVFLTLSGSLLMMLTILRIFSLV